MSDFKETQHGRNHRPGGSDPIPGIGGIQFNSGTYGPENVGDWLSIETTGFGGPLSAGVMFQVEYDFRTELNGGEWNLNTNGGPIMVTASDEEHSLTGTLNLRADGDIQASVGGQIYLYNDVGSYLLIDSGGGTVFLHSEADLTIEASGSSDLTIDNTGSGDLILSSNGEIQANLVVGQVLRVRDNGNNAIFEVREDASIHIKTGQTVTADL